MGRTLKRDALKLLNRFNKSPKTLAFFKATCSKLKGKGVKDYYFTYKGREYTVSPIIFRTLYKVSQESVFTEDYLASKMCDILKTTKSKLPYDIYKDLSCEVEDIKEILTENVLKFHVALALEFFKGMGLYNEKVVGESSD